MSDFTWENLPLLTTGRLYLRALTPLDRQALFAIYGDAEVMHYTSDPVFPDPSYIDQMLTSVATLFQQRQSLEWGITLHHDDVVIGTCGLHSFDFAQGSAEIGCLLKHSYWGQALMQEALEAVIAFGFTVLHLNTIYADIDAPNMRSSRLFQRLGFAQVDDAGTIYTRRRTP
jgi:[ribosomal protein S5]-alanine N-acetyltransferase